MASNKSCCGFNISNGVFVLEENRTTNIFINKCTQSLTIAGNGNTTIECKQNAGLAFKNVTNIIIQKITFHNCGMIFNSTSENPNSTNTTLTSKAALLFEYCNNVNLTSITVNNSDGVGIQMYNTIGNVNISHSIFSENKIKESHAISGGGGIYIEFSLCEPGTNGNNCTRTQENFTTKAVYKIEESRFINNTGTVTDPKKVAFLRSGSYTHYAFGRGGGLSVYIKGNSSCNSFVIKNCIFEDNVALYGAGMFVELQDSSNYNSFTIQNSEFLSNKVISTKLGYTGTSGGGVMVDYIIYSSENTAVLYNNATFINATFRGNAAYNGGGFSFHSSKENNVIKPANVLHFIGCHWYENKAALGAAIDLGVLHSSENGQLVKPQFSNCTFMANEVTAFTVDHIHDAYSITDANSTNTSGGYWPGSGTMYLDTITVDFLDNVVFTNNTGGAVVAIDAGVNVHQHASVEFSNNKAELGGALSLSGYSWISVSPHVNISFISNYARDYGGAIHFQKSGQHDLLSSDNCFIRYTEDTVAPYSWKNVSFLFLDNCASSDYGGDAIYTTTVVDCAWNGSFSYANVTTLKSIFLDWPNFKFENQRSDCTNFIQTAARTVKLNKPITSLSVIPGKPFNFPFTATNDFGNVTSGVFMIFTSNKNVSIPNPVVQTDGTTLLRSSRVNSNFYLEFETVDNRKHVGYITVTLQNCPIGFFLNDDICECITANNSNSYEGVAYCSASKSEIYIQPGYWAGYVREHEFFSTSVCPFSYCIQTNHPIALTGNNTLCKNRTGRLCGECKPGYGLSVGTQDCVNCTGSHLIAWSILIATTYVPISIVFIALLVLNVNLAVGPIHSFIFFCQVFPAISLDNNHWGDYSSAITIISNIHSAVINIMSLRFNMYYTTKYCLSTSMKNMDYYLLQYALALYPLAIMVIILSIIRYCPGCIPAKYLWYAVKRCVKAIRRRTSLQQTVIHGFITFMLLTYANFVNISFQILAYAYFEDNTGQHKGLLVPLRQGTMEYFGSAHWPYAVTAVCFLVIFGILPLVLFILYPVILMIIAHFEWDNTRQVHTLRRWIPLYRLMPVYDTFWTEFKPKCQVFAGLYFLYRFLAFSLFAFATTVYQIYFGMSILFMIAMFLHAFFQPYNNQMYNKVDFFIFANLSIINTFYAYSEFLRTQKVSQSTIENYLWVRTVLAWVPIVFIIYYLMLKIRMHCRRDEHLFTGNYGNRNEFIEPLLDRVDYDEDEDNN